jgi:uncharacterized protein YydD (DUF2326 family)
LSIGLRECGLSSFRVLPQFREIEGQANILTSEIHGLVNANIVDRRRLERYRDSLVDEGAPTADRLEALYDEAGAALPGDALIAFSTASKHGKKLFCVRHERPFVRESYCSRVSSRIAAVAARASVAV